jgi:hypothetical protein
MEALASEVARLVLSQGGLLGALVLVEAFVIGWQQRRLDRAAVALESCQNARIENGIALATTIERSTTTGATLVASREAQMRLLEEIQRSVMELLRQGETGAERAREVAATVRQLAERRRGGGT